MLDYLCLKVTFLDPRYHGRGDGGNSEWPPSPLRLFQAIVSANADDIGIDGDLDRALTWLEQQPPPLIVAPTHEQGSAYCLSVPNNAMDIVGKAWSKGNYFGINGKGKYFGKCDANPATHRTMKTIRPIRMIGGDTVYYAWELTKESKTNQDIIQPLIKAAQRVVALGWGIDLVVGRGDCITTAALRGLPGERWVPATMLANVNALRTPTQGTLIALQDRYAAFLHRISDTGFVPVEPLTQFKISGYRRATDPILRPHVVFELRHDDGSFCRYSQRKLIHIAGMVRHLAKEAMMLSPPAGVDKDWVERYVAGHACKDRQNHQQFSYLPLPSIGHRHADQAVRRVMIASPVGDDAWLEHLARRLHGQRLKPEKGNEFGEQSPPILVRTRHDKVASCYTATANRWASVTPVILPGHDDHKPAKTRRLIETALAQSGIEQPCTFEWSPFSCFRNSLSAHKYDRDRKPIGYIRPDYLLSQTAVHLTLQFENDLKVPGPLAIGAGRHCGLGLFAPVEFS